MKKHLLIVDDERAICNALKFALEDEYDVKAADTLEAMEIILRSWPVEIALVDLKFGQISGIDMITRVVELNPCAIVIMITAYGTIETAIQAIKAGAYDYVLKPVDLNQLRKLLADSERYYELKKAQVLADIEQHKMGRIVGNSPKLKRVMALVERVKNLDVTVLIQGETGTGKGLIAKEIHQTGLRREGPFVAVNCGAIPANLIESELFGYDKGAFTGADRSRKGVFEQAHGGTIFLDEVGEMDLSSQVKLLKAIEDGIITPLGSERSIQVDFRLIAATNQNLEISVKKGTFRSDLYYRLNVLPIELPALRERQQDIPALVAHFIDLANRQYKLSIAGIEQGALDRLIKLPYKGNIRELENIVFRLCILSQGEIIRADDGFLDAFDTHDDERYQEQQGAVRLEIGTKMAEAERLMIMKTLDYVGGNKQKAAKLLGISERSMHYKVNQYHSAKEE